MKKKVQIYRHGDVNLVKVDKLPDSAAEIKEEGIVTLAHGEVTGHHHSIYNNSAATQYKSLEAEFLEVKEAVELKHHEHKPITIQPGTYQKVIAREYVNPDMVRKVVD